MSIEKIVFYAFSTILIVAALSVITRRDSVKAVLSLVLCFFAAAALWMLLEAEFLAVSLVLVYVGAVMVLFLFVVMMLDIDFAAIKQGFTRYMPVGIVAAAVFLGGLYWLINSGLFDSQSMPMPAPHDADYSNIEELGMLLYTHYFYPFELAAVILLVAIIAAISLTYRGSRSRKVQNIAEQVSTKKEDRLRIIKMDPVIEETIDESNQQQNSTDSTDGGKS